MKTSKLFLTGLVLLGVVACQKVETPVVPEEQEIVVPEEPQEVQPQQQPDVKSVAGVLNEVASAKEVLVALPDILLEINRAESPWHLDLNIARADNELSYVCGTVGLTKGVYHLVVLDLDIMVMNMFPIVGTVDAVYITANLVKAACVEDDTLCDSYLAKATAGLDVTVESSFRMKFLRSVGEDNKRIIDLYLYDAENPDYEPVSLSDLLKLLQGS